MLSLRRSLAFLAVTAIRSFPVSRRRIATAFIAPSVVQSVVSAPLHFSAIMPEELPVYESYLDAESAYALDQELMSVPGFSLEQLMELAGLSVAQAVYEVAPRGKSIILICGPGNNGGDGLVAARHLTMFGFNCIVVYPKRSSKQHFVNLVQQCLDVGCEVKDTIPKDSWEDSGVVVDAIFGFSFRGEPREPFKSILEELKEVQGLQDIVSVAVDVPSGWNVDEGDVAGSGLVPDVLVSLTAPKLCSKRFHGRHFVGGRFLPPALATKYGVSMPPYQGVTQVMEVAPNFHAAES